MNFGCSVPRNLLEELATNTLESDSVHIVSRVKIYILKRNSYCLQIYDQYLNYISLEKDFFSLNERNSYLSWNDPTISDTQAETNIHQIVDSLFSVLVTMESLSILLSLSNFYLGCCANY